MASSSLIIRNLTSKPVELKNIEYTESQPGLSKISNAKSFLRRFDTSPAPLNNVKVLNAIDVSVILQPFNLTKTEIRLGDNPGQSVRLTFELQNARYRLDELTPTTISTTLTPLSSNTGRILTAVYSAKYFHLTLYSSASLQSWMGSLKDQTPLSALSIPGTHNSPTCHLALPSVRCQATSPPEQLENGVRFFDIRVQPEAPQDLKKDNLVLVHSVFPISLTGPKYFRGLVNEIYTFLDRNPSETLIMSIKREGKGNATDSQLSRILKDHYANDGRWFTVPRIPKLGEVRGKIVLIRRFGLEEGLKHEWDGAGWGIDAEVWADNTPNAICPSGDICVQDFYEVTDTKNIEQKIKYSQDHLARAAQCVSLLSESPVENADTYPKQPLFINFLTASNFWNPGCWPDKIAAKINPHIVDYLCVKHNKDGGDEESAQWRCGDGSTGIVVCDWVGHQGNWDLVRCILGMNAKLEMREQTS